MATTASTQTGDSFDMPAPTTTERVLPAGALFWCQRDNLPEQPGYYVLGNGSIVKDSSCGGKGWFDKEDCHRNLNFIKRAMTDGKSLDIGSWANAILAVHYVCGAPLYTPAHARELAMLKSEREKFLTHYLAQHFVNNG